MTRTSVDEYKMPDGSIVGVPQSQEPPEGAKIWNGYDYQSQRWMHNGEIDRRSLKELEEAINRRKGR